MPNNDINTGHQGAWQKMCKVTFAGNQGIMRGKPNLVVTNGAPSTITAPVGTLAWDVTNSDGYVCTVASTTWVKMNA